MKRKCKGKICKTCGDFQVKVLEEFTDKNFDIRKIANYLGWKEAPEEKGVRYISREKFPRLEIIEFKITKGNPFIFWKRSKTQNTCIVFIKEPAEVHFSEKQKIKKSKVVDQVKRVEIFSSKGASLILTSHELYGFGVEI